MPEVDDVLAGRYELEEVIASGGMATVWRARDQVLARIVAVKILHPHLASDEAFLERFRREAIAAAGLTHPHVVAVYDTGEAEEADSRCHYIVMEHCGGGTLADLLRTTGPFEAARVAGVGTTICDALSYAHERSIVHRDVKPANVLGGDDGLLKVGDFGIAKAISAGGDITTTGKIMGTVAYISPEYATDQELDARSDIYSLGIVLYELAVGRPPFQESTSIATAMRHIKDAPQPLRNIRAGIPRSLESVVMTALEKDPDKRFQSAADMATALASVASRGERTPPTVVRRTNHEDSPSSFRAESRWIIPVLGLIIGAVLLAAIAAWVIDDDPRAPERSRRGSGSGSGAVVALKVDPPSDFDPYADGTEDSSGLAAVVDGDATTMWKTDTYQEPLSFYKPGVGVLFDLGSSRSVVQVAIETPDQDLDVEVLAGDDRPSTDTDLDSVSAASFSGEHVFDVYSTARYWLVWITDLPGGQGGVASLGEVTFLGP
ncbi:MAG: eukaryotic-like serine/threonine-protein kinase [Actinomycetota bacterium]|nr:eukaryotic-like serine/threonine-protein kinase [Actinomycetota bacterium]